MYRYANAHRTNHFTNHQAIWLFQALDQDLCHLSKKSFCPLTYSWPPSFPLYQPPVTFYCIPTICYPLYQPPVTLFNLSSPFRTFSLSLSFFSIFLPLPLSLRQSLSLPCYFFLLFYGDSLSASSLLLLPLSLTLPLLLPLSLRRFPFLFFFLFVSPRADLRNINS